MHTQFTSGKSVTRLLSVSEFEILVFAASCDLFR
jgi:hypothetical protein